MHLSQKIIASILALGVCAFVAGCGGEQAKPQGTVSQKIMNTQSKIAFAPATEIKEGRKTIYAVIKSANSAYWQELNKGMIAGAKAANVNLYIGGVTQDGNWEGQKALLKELRSIKHDAVIIGPSDSTKMADICKIIFKEKKNLFLVDTGINGPDYAAAFKSNNLKAGQDAAAKLLALMKANGVKESDNATIVIKVSNMGSGTIAERVDSALSYWKDHAPKTWKIDTNYQIDHDDASISTKMLNESLQKDKTIKGILVCNGTSTGFTVDTLMKNNRKDIAMVGFDMSSQVEKGLADNSYKFATIMQNQYKMGFEAVKAAAAAVNGTAPSIKDVDTGINVVDNSNYKK